MWLPHINEDVTIARAHVHTPLLYLENGWTDCADIWHVASGQLVMWLQHAHCHGVSTHYAREHVHTSLLYLLNGWTDYAQICYVSRDRYDMWLRQSNGGVSARAHVHTPSPFWGLGLNRVTHGWWLWNFYLAGMTSASLNWDVGHSMWNHPKKYHSLHNCDTSRALARSSPTRRYTGANELQKCQWSPNDSEDSLLRSAVEFYVFITAAAH